MRKGQTGKRNKLSARQVREMRARYARGGVTLRQLAREYGVVFSVVGMAIRGNTWKRAGGEIVPAAVRLGRRCKLTPEQRADLRARHRAGGLTLFQLGQLYGVSRTTAKRVIAEGK